MQLGSGGPVIPLPAACPGQSHAGGPGKFNSKLNSKVIDWLIIYFSCKI